MEEKRPSEDRLVMLCDGVFAIAMTLLVLDIRLPDVPPDIHGVRPELLPALIDLVPKFISYVISFMMIANYWGMHRRIMHYLRHIDGSFIRFNILLLFFVTALPISTSFAFTNYEDPGHLSDIIYILSLAACGLALGALWLNATWKHRLVDPALGLDDINYFLLRLIIAPGFFLLSLLIFLIPAIPYYYIYFSWILISILYAIARRLQPRFFPHVTPEFIQQPGGPITTIVSAVQHHMHSGASEGTASGPAVYGAASQRQPVEHERGSDGVGVSDGRQ